MSKGFLHNALEGECGQYLKKAVLTSMLPLSGDISPTPRLQKRTVLDHSYSKHFGLLVEDMDYLFSVFDVDSYYQKRMIEKYNGYVINSRHACNIWSVINCLNKYSELKPSVGSVPKSHESKILKKYWIESGTLEHVVHLLTDRRVFDAFDKLVQLDDNIISFRLSRSFTQKDMVNLYDLFFNKDTTVKKENLFLSDEQFDLFFSYLFFLGYLTEAEYDVPLADGKMRARIPNNEIGKEIKLRLETFARFTK